MNGIYSFQASTCIYKGELLSIDGFGKVAPADPSNNIQIVGYAMNTVEEGEMCQVYMQFIPERGPISFYAPKNPIPYKNLEFEFNLKTGKPRTPVFELVFEGVARTFREVQMESREYRWFDNDDYLSRPYNPDEPIVFHDNRAIANYQYNCTIIYDKTNWRYLESYELEQHYEILLCVIGKNTHIFQEAHIKDTHEIFQISRSRTIKKLTIYADKRELILHEEVLQEKTDPRFNIELGECDRSLPSGKYDIEISLDYPYIA